MDEGQMKYKCIAFLHNAGNKEQNTMREIMPHVRSAGYANGYVAIPPEHPLFGKYYDYPEIYVHGGLTFSRPSRDIFEYFDTNAVEMLDGEIPIGYWVFGFDTFHPGDNPDTCSREWCIEETNRLKTILENWK